MNKKTILITGCSSGIGYHTAKTLQARGYRVFATARKPEDVDRLNSEGLESLQLDLSESTSINAAVKKVLTLTAGELYALFNNGAFGQPGAVEDLSREVLLNQFETNVFGCHELTCAVIPHMRKQGYGRIIQNSSVLGLITLPYRGAYNASKFALEGLSDTLRLELADTNIHVSLIEPGPILSRFRANAHELFKRNIDIENSAHKDSYVDTGRRLAKIESSNAPFTLGPEAVCDKVIHALESNKPKVRYYVTKPTYFFAYARRLLSSRLLDKLLLSISVAEAKRP